MAENSTLAIQNVDIVGECRRCSPAPPYTAVLAIHPRYVIDEQAGILTELAEADENSVFDDAPHLSTMIDTGETDERAEPEVPVYSDILLLLDALEREDPTALGEIETPALASVSIDREQVVILTAINT